MISNLTFYDESKADNEDERKMLAGWNNLARLNRELSVFNPDFQVCGPSKTLTDGENGLKTLGRNGEVLLQYKRGTYLFLSHDKPNDLVSLKSIWTEPKLRGQGRFREVVRELKKFAVEKSLWMLIAANPFESKKGIDPLLLDFEDMEYINSPQNRDKTAQMLKEEGFIETSLVRLNIDDIEPLLVRIVRNYSMLVPRMFVFNNDDFEEEEFDESIYALQLERIKKDLEENPDKYSEMGYRKNPIW